MSERALPGSNERPDGTFANDKERSTEAPIAPGVYIVTQRPASLSAKLLPPLLLIALGACFLVYRVAAADWRGLSALADWFEPAAKSEKPALTTVPLPVPPPTALAQNADPVKPGEPALEPPKVEHVPKVEADPLADIEREAEKEKARLAEMEKLKAREEEKLAATADQRLEEQREEQFGKRGIDPRQLARLMELQRQFMRGHDEMFGQMQRQQMEAMQEMQQRFLGRGGPNPRRLPMPGTGFGMIPPPQLPPPGKDGEEVVTRTPDGGITRFRRFEGPNSNGFFLEFRSGNGQNLLPPPPPKPGLRNDHDPDAEDSPTEPLRSVPQGKRID